MIIITVRHKPLVLTVPVDPAMLLLRTNVQSVRSVARPGSDFLEQRQNSLSLEWLDDEINCSITDGFHECLFLIKGGDDDDLSQGIDLANLAQSLEPPHHGHDQVHRHEVGLEPFIKRDSLLSVACLAGYLPAGL